MSTEPRYTIGHTMVRPFMVSLYIEEAGALTPEQLEADLPQIMEAVRKEHAALLAHLERKQAMAMSAPTC